MAKKKTYENLKPADKAKVDVALKKLDTILSEIFANMGLVCEGRDHPDQALHALTAVMVSQFKAAGVNIDPPKFRWIKEDKVGPADEYTTMMMVCAMNGLPIYFNRETCPKTMETQAGVFSVDPKDMHIILVPKISANYIEIKFSIAKDGELRGVK